jgi:plastocyanin
MWGENMYRISLLALTFVLLSGFFIADRALAQTTHQVTVGDNFFSPSDLEIQVGDTVRWVNAAGGMSHNVTSSTGAFTGSQTASSFTFEVTFNNPGSFPYECTIHFGMSGTITVTGEAAGSDLEVVSVDAIDDGEGSQLQVAGGGVITVPNAFGAGASLAIETVVRNNGNAASDPYTVSYHASTDATITAQDPLLGSVEADALGAGAMNNHEDTVTIPTDLAAGDYFIGARLGVDDDDANNNAASDPETVALSGPFEINSGLNDAWVAEGIRRQGILIAVLPTYPYFFAAWFTYDLLRPPVEDTSLLADPGHAWLTLEGGWSGNTAELQVLVTAGGVFADGDPLPNAAVAIGTMTIEFHDCNSATANYEIPAPGPFGTIPEPGLSGTLSLSRSAPDNNNITLCQELNQVLLDAR